jgi:hypothetical protein
MRAAPTRRPRFASWGGVDARHGSASEAGARDKSIGRVRIHEFKRQFERRFEP